MTVWARFSSEKRPKRLQKGPFLDTFEALQNKKLHIYSVFSLDKSAKNVPIEPQNGQK